MSRLRPMLRGLAVVRLRNPPGMTVMSRPLQGLWRFVILVEVCGGSKSVVVCGKARRRRAARDVPQVGRQPSEKTTRTKSLNS